MAYRGPQRYQMAMQHANHMAAATGNRMNGARRDGQMGGSTMDANSVVGYIPDDISSVHSSALGGGGATLSQYPPMFQGFQETWPQLPHGMQQQRTNGPSMRTGGPESIAGESVTASEVTESYTSGNTRQGVPGQGGVSLAGLSINDLNKQASLSQSDKLRRYVEGQQAAPQPPIGAGRTVNRSTLEHDEDARSISTSFASQVGGVSGYD